MKDRLANIFLKLAQKLWQTPAIPKPIDNINNFSREYLISHGMDVTTKQFLDKERTWGKNLGIGKF